MVAFGFPYLEKLVIDVRITGAPPPLDFSRFPHLVNVKLAGNFPLDDSVIFSMTQQLKVCPAFAIQHLNVRFQY